MKLYIQDRLAGFSCIASACRHTCCAGWEISVDPETAERYLALPGKTGEKMRRSLIAEDDSFRFRTGPDKRCPFLAPSGLCELITEFGEGVLCEICREHPRWYNDQSDRTEAGLGLCCEEAARILLTSPEPMRMVLWEDDGGGEQPEPGEAAMLGLRDRMIALAQDRSVSLRERTEQILRECGYGPLIGGPVLWRDRLLSLERLNEAWTEELMRLSPCSRIPAGWDLPGEQLLCSFLYRHVLPGSEDGRIRERIAFSVLGTRLVLLLLGARGAEAGQEDLIDLSRMFSGEIEYSDENEDLILEYLDRDRGKRQGTDSLTEEPK